MPLYENVFIARQDITPAQVDGLIETFEKVITDGGGSVVDREKWGLKTLAYKIKKNRKGHYTLMHISSAAEAIHEMERQMRINEDVLRYISIRVEEFDDGPSAMMRSRDREDRPRRSREDREPQEDDPTSVKAPDTPKDPPIDAKEGTGDIST
tara:strand:+ start:427 stop:885 length:459 start_codon:yes stop_codon:yes gene_type:complete